jgi:hypothetical protein
MIDSYFFLTKHIMWNYKVHAWRHRIVWYKKLKIIVCNYIIAGSEMCKISPTYITITTDIWHYLFFVSVMKSRCLNIALTAQDMLHQKSARGKKTLWLNTQDPSYYITSNCLSVTLLVCNAIGDILLEVWELQEQWKSGSQFTSKAAPSNHPDVFTAPSTGCCHH